jgi:putative endonuclease
MEFFVYIIQSELDGSYYTGHTHNVVLRLEHHNDGWTRSTKAKRPWKTVHVEPAKSKGDAMKREREIKCMKSRVYIERLIDHA